MGGYGRRNMAEIPFVIGFSANQGLFMKIVSFFLRRICFKLKEHG